MDSLDSKYYQELLALRKEYEEFVYIISHDLKSPVRAISNIANWIEEDLEGQVNDEIAHNFSLMKNRVGRLENMMDALLELSRVKRFELEFYDLNLPKLIKECAEIAETKPNIEFHISFVIENENMITLGNKLEKVIVELLSNAVQFHDKEKINIFIEIKETQSDYQFTIRDDGPGIPEELRANVFKIFYTVNAKDLVETTGAGLTICAKIVEMVGGQIECFPVIGGIGSVFRFNWPKKIIL